MMTLDEFFVKLSEIGRAWVLDDCDYIRTVHSGRCPLSAVATDCGFNVWAGSILSSKDFLAMDHVDAMEIAHAADDSPSCSPRLRQRLLEACNLIVPEITERKPSAAHSCPPR